MATLMTTLFAQLPLAAQHCSQLARGKTLFNGH